MINCNQQVFIAKNRNARIYLNKNSVQNMHTVNMALYTGSQQNGSRHSCGGPLYNVVLHFTVTVFVAN